MLSLVEIPIDWKTKKIMVVIPERLCEKASEIERRKELAVWPGVRRTHRRRDTVGAHQLHAHGDGVDAALVRSVGVEKKGPVVAADAEGARAEEAAAVQVVPAR
jgi:hypothetical protein